MTLPRILDDADIVSATPRAVVLLSGGLDSCVAATAAIASGRDVIGLAIAYGQRHSCELDAARVVADVLRIPLHLVRADVSSVVGSALLGSRAVQKGRSTDEIRADSRPSTFVPARNAMFLSIASAFAVSIQAQEIWVGSNADDANGYPDCRTEFFRAFEQTSIVGGFGIRVVHPLTERTKREVVKLARELGAPIDLTWSCYAPVGSEGEEQPCESCDACMLRNEALR